MKMKTVSVMREAPKNSHLKFDYDKKLKCFKLSKVLPAGMLFLFDFGFIPIQKVAMAIHWMLFQYLSLEVLQAVRWTAG
jgi:hypothetical protein